MSDAGDPINEITLEQELVDKAEQEVISFLPECDLEELKGLCTEIGLEVPEDKNTRKLLYRFVLAHLFQIEGEHADGGKAKYLQIHAYFRGQKIAQQHQQLEQIHPVPVIPNVQPQEGVRKLPPPPFEYKAQPLPREYPISPVLKPAEAHKKPANLYHLKDCKIKGTIGNPGEKDKLDYDELISQITEREMEGYDENRIVGAVINAIAAGNPFKIRLVMRRNLEGVTLPVLRGMLRRHYKQKESQHILTELTEAVQAHCF